MSAVICELCDSHAGDVIFASEQWRVVLVDDPLYPGFCRVIWNAHVKEMTDLSAAERNDMMEAVWRVEQAMRDVMHPEKINLASFGNMVPHLHWHIIPRYNDDAHFPQPIWAQAKTYVLDKLAISTRQALLSKLKAVIVARLS